MSEKASTYRVALVCTNCGYRQEDTFAIPKGTKIWPATSETPCENCGCTGTLVGIIPYVGTAPQM